MKRSMQALGGLAWGALLMAQDVSGAEPQSCIASPAGVDVLESLGREIRAEGCKKFDPEGSHIQRGSDPVCGEFGLSMEDRIDTLDKALLTGCDVLRFYLPAPGHLKDPMSELALACNMRYAQKRLSSKLKRDGETEKSLVRRSARARLCAEKIFSGTYSIPDQMLAVDPENPWSNYQHDLELIERSSLSEIEKEKAVDALSQGKLTVEGKRSPIKNKRAVDAFETVMAQERASSGIEPKKGEPISWSSEFKGCVGKQFSPYTHFSRTLGTLAIGLGIKLSPTGKELPLHDWILQQEDASIEPAELFRQSYRLNDGDVYQSLLTVENLLSRAWLVKERDHLAQTKKLRPIVHSVGPESDNYGAWYHFFGTLLHAYSTNGFSASAVANIEALGSLGLDGRFEFQETHINRAGARVGARLSHSLDGELENDADALEFDSYVRVDGDLARPIRKQLKKME